MSETTTEKKDRVVFANKIKVGDGPVDLAELKKAGKIKAPDSTVQSVYKTICDKAIKAGAGKAWPAELPEGATFDAFRRALVGYAAKHYEQTFDVIESGQPGLVYVGLSTRARKKKAVAETDQSKS